MASESKLELISEEVKDVYKGNNELDLQLSISGNMRCWTQASYDEQIRMTYKDMTDLSFDVNDMESSFWILSTYHRYSGKLPGEILVSTKVNHSLTVMRGINIVEEKKTVLKAGFTYEDLFNIIGCYNDDSLIHINGRTIAGHPDSCGLITKYDNINKVLRYDYGR